MERQYLTESNVVIDYLAGRLTEKGKAFMNQVINEIPILSVITKIEVLGFNTSAEATQLLSQFINDSIIVGLSDKIVDKTIEIRKKHKIKTPDAIIAATSLISGFVLISRNTKDFLQIEGLEVINPYDL
jgi:predicted nucleic acid-binding protein